MLKGIHGRTYDIISTPDGRSLHPESVMYIFEDIQKKGRAFSQFQAIQDTLNQFTINIVPSKTWSKKTEGVISEALRKYISPTVTAKFNIVDCIPREKSGKMRVVKSNVGLERSYAEQLC